MFLCEDCHPKQCPYSPIESRSYGPCEGCGRTAGCNDCHSSLPVEPRPE